MILIAARVYEMDDLPAEERLCVDSLFERDGAFTLRATGGGAEEEWKPMSPESAREWLSELPEQITYFDR